MNLDTLKPQKLTLTILFIWMGLILVLGVWWLYLIVNSSTIPSVNSSVNTYRMAFYEGATFIVLLTGLFAYFIYLYKRDITRYNSLSNFFSSLTHELKTPLASIRLQAEVIDESIQQGKTPENLSALLNRLNNGVEKLEHELEKLLQLSRIERGAKLLLKTMSVEEFILKFNSDPYSRNNFRLKWIYKNQNFNVLMDEYALIIVLRNLIENSIKHASMNEATIEVRQTGKYIEFLYTDYGKNNGLDINKMSKLFYRGNHEQGSGIGLYLANKIMKAMKGEFEITNSKMLQFHLRLHHVI